MLRPLSYLAIFILGLTHIRAQSSAKSLREVLSQLEGQHGLTFSYADELVDRLTISDLGPNEDLAAQLQTLEDQTGLKFEASSQDIYVVRSISRDLCARITDEDSNALRGAQLIVNNLVTNFIADENGSIQFNTSLTFQDTITIMHLGYEDTKLSIKQLVNTRCPDIQMSFQATRLSEVVITNYLTNGINADLSDLTLKIQTQDLGLLPGETDGDILLALRSLPGITAPNGKAGNLHVRGSTTDQTLLLFDNIPIYHKGHYYGTISPYNPAVVQSVSVHRSGFDPSLGGRVGGVIKLRSKKSIVESPIYRVGINSYYTAISTQLPIKKKLMLTGAIRTAYPNSFRSPKLDAINTMVYQPSNISFAELDPNADVQRQDYSFLDYNLGAVYNMNQGQLSFSFLGIRNTQDTEILRPPRTVANDFGLTNKGGNIEWQQFWSPKVSSKISIMKSRYDYSNITRGITPNMPTIVSPVFESTIDDFGFIFDLEFDLGRRSSSVLNLGYQLNKHELRNVMTGLTGPIERRSEARIHSTVLNFKSKPVQGLSLSTGLRSNYYTLTEELFLEPRLMASYAINESFSLKSSAGHYSQFIHQKIFFDFDDTKAENFSWELANQGAPVIKSGQLMAGAIWNKNNFIIDVELYQKQIMDLSVDNPNVGPPPNPPPGPPPPMGPPPPQQPNSALGELKVKGLDLLLRKRWSKFDAWVSYSYIETEMTFEEINQLPFITYYDQPHVLNVGVTMTVEKWKLSLGWQHASGIPRYTNSTFFPEAGPSEPTGMPMPVPAESNEGRFSSQHQLDLAVVYDISPKNKGWRGSVGLSILNVYDRENLVEENFYLFGQISQTPILDRRYGIGFAPNLMLNLQF